MKPKERMLTAINKGIPDRLPVTIHQWQDYHLKYHMGGMDALSAFQECGMDASIQYCEPLGQFWVPLEEGVHKFSNEWQDEVKILCNEKSKRIVRHGITTPKGCLSYQTEANEQTIWLTEFPIKQPEDIFLLKHMPVPKLDKKAIEREYDRIGDHGILRGLILGDQGGCWQQACSMCDTLPMIYAANDEPEWVHAFLNILLEKKLEFIYESVRGARFDIVETGGGASSSTVISPGMFKEFCLPYDRKIHDALHDAGHKVTYHTCGGMKGIFDLIIETNTDASETLSPSGVGGNVQGPEAYEALHGKVCMIGGMDQINILTLGTPEKIREEVFRLFEVFGKGGGYIMSASDHFFEAPEENLTAFSNAAKECLY